MIICSKCKKNSPKLNLGNYNQIAAVTDQRLDEKHHLTAVPPVQDLSLAAIYFWDKKIKHKISCLLEKIQIASL